MKIISKIDKTECNGLLGLSIHLRKYNMTVLDYYIKYENFEIPTCEYCDKKAKYKSGISFRKTCGSDECKSKELKNRTVSEELKQKLRKRRLEYLSKRSGKTAWERRSQGKLSYLEKWFNDKCIEYNLPRKFDIVNEYTVSKYSIDFAFVNEKIAVELDGKCHFVNGDERIETDIKKDEFLISNGWKVFRIRYDELTDTKFQEFIEFIGSGKTKNFDSRIYRNIELSLVECKNQKCNKLHQNNKYCSQKCYGGDVSGISKPKLRKVKRPPYEVLIKEINKLGYSGTGRKYDVSDNSIRKWKKFYEKN